MICLQNQCKNGRFGVKLLYFPKNILLRYQITMKMILHQTFPWMLKILRIHVPKLMSLSRTFNFILVNTKKQSNYSGQKKDNRSRLRVQRRISGRGELWVPMNVSKFEGVGRGEDFHIKISYLHEGLKSKASAAQVSG